MYEPRNNNNQKRVNILSCTFIPGVLVMFAAVTTMWVRSALSTFYSIKDDGTV